MSNFLYVKPKDEAHRAMLVEHYEFLGYYVKMVNGRLQVSSTKPEKPKKKVDEKNRTTGNSDRNSESSRSNNGERSVRPPRSTRSS